MTYPRLFQKKEAVGLYANRLNMSSIRPLALEVHKLCQELVLSRYYLGARLETPLGRYHVDELPREVHVRELQGARLDKAHAGGPGPAGQGAARVVGFPPLPPGSAGWGG